VRLAQLARECGAKVNLIPYNETGNRKFTRPSKEVIKNFESRLLQNGIKVTIRVEKGSDSNAACGQLRASSKEQK
jgi:23S rRNA (adenine2503-C2)-methyltransferase